MNVLTDLPTPFPALALVLGGELFLVVYDNGDGLTVMTPPPSTRQKAARAQAEKQFGKERNKWADGVRPNGSGR